MHKRFRLCFLALMLATTVTAGAEEPPVIELYTISGCHECADFEELLHASLLPALAQLGVLPEVRAFDIMEPAGYERLLAEAARLAWEFRGVPLLRAGDKFFYGDELADRGLARAVSEALASQPAERTMEPASLREPSAEEARDTAASPAATRPGGRQATAIPGLRLWVVLGAGLVDGINPCALATLLFMISALSLGGRGRASVAAIGASFILGVFSTYFLMGLGLLRVGAIISSLPWLRTVLRAATALGLWVLGALSFRDWRAIRRNRTSEIRLRLPDSTIRRVHKLIRGGAPVWLSGFGAVALGILVSMSEFVCTGQVYLPTLVYIAQSRSERAIALLVAYNLAFIAPLIPVFALVMLGFSHARLTELFRGNLAATKLCLAIFFVSFGAVLLVGILP